MSRSSSGRFTTEYPEGRTGEQLRLHAVKEPSRRGNRAQSEKILEAAPEAATMPPLGVPASRC